ncbi:MAG: iron chelate uptake ABC transporter family permease subunit [Aeromicrobium sp.]|uniref:FecCD family ABC transporter permease n=1 Tax=Aeromicrobium sp. TaxID=1871063 RepID=UPI0039E6700E
MTGNRRRSVIVGAVLVASVAGVFVGSIAVGDYFVSFGDVLGALFGRGTPRVQYVVTDLRLPRALVGVLAGAAFGVSGAIFQAIARNPLASPDIIGVTAGSSAAAVVGIVAFGVSGTALSALAFTGGFAAAAVIYLLSWRQGMSGYRMVLVGIGVAAFLSAITAFLLVRAARNELQRATVWMTGSLTDREWDHVPVLAVTVVVLVPLVVALARSIHVLMLGDDSAKSLGLRLEITRGVLVLAGVALAATATAAAGPITFVAFVAPAVARALVGSTVSVFPSAAFGALLVPLADLVGRTALLGVALPVGVVTGLIGGGYFICLLATAGKVERGA